MKASSPRVVGARVDWLEWRAKVNLSHSVRGLDGAVTYGAVEALRERGLQTQRDQQPKDVLVDGIAFKMHPVRVEDVWLLQNDDCRVKVQLRGPGAHPDAPNDPGYNVEVIASSLGLLRLGVKQFIAICWRIARAMGRVRSARFGRRDLCVDVANYKLREDDRHSFVHTASTLGSREHHVSATAHVRKMRQVRPDGSIHREHEVKWQLVGDAEDAADGLVVYRVGQTLSGFVFGSGKGIMARVYDKQLEMSVRCPEKREDEHRYWRSRGWKGIEKEPYVTRVEVQIRGEPLKEYSLQHETEDSDRAPELQSMLLEGSLDSFWQAMTADRVMRGAIDPDTGELGPDPDKRAVRGWLRLIRRGSGARDSDCKLQSRWSAVSQAVFVEASDYARPRMRNRGAAKCAQLRGIEHSLLGSMGRFPEPQWPAKNGDAARVGVDEHRLVAEYESISVDESDQTASVLRAALERGRLQIAMACADLETADLVERARARRKRDGLGTEDDAAVYRDALAMSWGYERAARARFATVAAGYKLT